MKRRVTAALLAASMAASQILPLNVSASWVPDTVGFYEAESGVLSGNARVEKKQYVSGFEKDGDCCTVTVEIPSDGFYDLDFRIRGLGGYKENYVLVDNAQVGKIIAQGGEFNQSAVRRIYLTAGTHTVGVMKFWGYIEWDSLTVLTSEPFDESVFDISAKLVNENATENARRLFSYLCDQYGKKIISGQYCDTGYNGWEILQISQNDGNKFPAILGLDLGYYSQTGVDHDAKVRTTDLAIGCWEKGGIVTLCWHWLAPQKFIKGTWYSAFRPEEVNMNLTAMMNGEDSEGLALLMQDIDNIAQQLLRMQEAGVPVLWRPLHEASGGWFWWGAEGADTYKKLYILLYETLTKEYGLNNLIWVWNGQDPEWYPGDAYVDIIGTDIYAGPHVYTSQIDEFLNTMHSTEAKKMVVLSENGTMIDPELSVRDRAMWGYFCTWSGEFVMVDGLKKKYSEAYTEIDMLSKVYNSEYVVTRDELPDLKSYPIRDDAK